MPRDRSPSPSWFALIASCVAGLGHLIIGRPRRGLLLFLGATASWNAALLSWVNPVAPLGAWSLRLGVAIGGATSLFSIIDVFRLGVYARLPIVTARREKQLARAIDHYLRREFRDARRLLDALLDVDPADPVVRLYLATLERRAGSPDRAVHHARKALAAAPHHPLQPEIERELHLARAGRHRTAPGHASGPAA